MITTSALPAAASSLIPPVLAGARSLTAIGEWAAGDPASSPLVGRPQPQRDRGGLHRLVDHGKQLRGQRVEVDLCAQADAERLDGLGRVVAAPVEAPVVHLLAPATGRLDRPRPSACPSSRTAPV